MKKRIKFYIFFLLSTVLVVVLSFQVKKYFGESDYNTFTPVKKRVKPNTDIYSNHPDIKYNFIAHRGFINIEHDIKTPNVYSRGSTFMDGMNRDEIAAFRLKRIKKYQQLNFFHPKYHPFKYYHQKIYNSISQGKAWLGPTPYYIANPYLLIIMTCANHVTPLNLYCPDVSIVYENGIIKEIRSGKSASCWFNYVYNNNDYPGKIWPIMVNAWDAGFFFIQVDISHSRNIKESKNPNHITNKIYNRRYFYHVGKYKVNNISPTDKDAWINLKNRDLDTKIYIKLWKKLPKSLKQIPDLIYIFIVKP